MVHWLGLGTVTVMAQVTELRSCKHCGMGKKKKNLIKNSTKALSQEGNYVCKRMVRAAKVETTQVIIKRAQMK